jgi:starch synthase
MKILAVTSEIFPLIKTGGLADVAGSLPKALAPFGFDTVTLVPGYASVLGEVRDQPPLVVLDDVLGERVALHHVRRAGLSLFILDAPQLFDREGGPYVDTAGIDHPDNWKRFAVLSLVGAEIAAGLLPGWRPDVVHVHDWQSALVPVYLRQFGINVPSVLTIHNLAFQGKFGIDRLSEIGLSPRWLGLDGLEYYGDISYLKGGIVTADVITTVSPTYAREILTPDFGMGLDGVLATRGHRLRGIVNGIDPVVWNPATDPCLPTKYDLLSFWKRRENRAPLLAQFGLDADDGGPIFAAVSRLTWQKGMDLLAEVADEIVDDGGRLIVCGNGDAEIQAALKAVAARYPGRVAVRIGYDEPTAHLIHGGADVVVQPSRFEPCGLTQLYAMRYGAVPVVGRTGGLSETIIDANDAAVAMRAATGFQFHPVTADGLRFALRRACEAYRQPAAWARLQAQAMRAEFSWQRSAGQYAEIFRVLAAGEMPWSQQSIRRSRAG